MPPIIQKLPEHLINQIAAGEVVETPAAAIKELVENSLDAGATTIEITITAGGFHTLSVSDNGHGMAKEQLANAFLRHATSKIGKLEDLETHYKMGFRGEALASIAACSRVILQTALVDGLGTAIELHGGELISETEVSLKKGTHIEVKDLFFNTPARKKFQKSVTQSAQEIHKILIALALAHPQISFCYKADKATLFDVKVEPDVDFKKAFKKRLYPFFPTINIDKGQFLELHDPLVHIQGFIAPFESHSAHRRGQYFIVNNRPIEAFNLSYALGEALKTFLPEKRFFQGVIHLNIDPKWIDINIHPQKKEIRFAEEGYIKELLKQLVSPKTPKAHFDFPTPTPIIPYTVSQKQEVLIPQALPHQELVSWIRTIGYYPPYLLIESAELPFFGNKKGLVLFDTKKGQQVLKLSLLLHNKTPLNAQSLLIAIPLVIDSLEKKLILHHHPLWSQLGFGFNQEIELTAHPAELDGKEAKTLVLEILQLLQKNMSEEDILSHCIESIFEKTRIPFETAQRLLSQCLQSPSIEPSRLFCLLTDSHLKEIFNAHA